MPFESKRSRTVVLRSDPVRSREIRGDGSGYNESSIFDLKGTQITESNGNPWTHQGFKGEDIGGPFRTEKNGFDDSRDASPSPQFNFSEQRPGENRFTHFGPLYPFNPGNLPALPVIESSDAQLGAWGTKAIALCKPTNSVASLSTSLAELVREGIPSLVGYQTWQSRARDVRSAGGEYLNIQFGWLPLVSEVDNFVNAVKNSEKILKQFERDAGRLVRRRYEFPLQEDISEPELYRVSAEPFTGGRVLRAPFYEDYPNQGKPIYRQRRTKVRRWFSGAFTYYLPTGSSRRDQISRWIQEKDKLYGTSITPEVLWNLTPWSWAADWIGNTGDVISNASDYLTDGLVLRYGYMMEHSIISDTYTLRGVNLKGYGSVDLSLTKSREVKKRVVATPFGFGITFDGFSTRQKAILAALGITRVR